MQHKNRDQIIEILSQVDRSMDKYSTVKEACENLGIKRSNYYRWQKMIENENLMAAAKFKRQQKYHQQRIAQLEDQVLALTYASAGN